MSEMEKNYEPARIEAKWYAFWQERGFFHGESGSGGKPYCIVIPPPNVTGILHMGHALNNTIQDALARWRRMQGRNVVWMPGTDHAGIATQNVVERALRKEGLSREALGREAFIQRVWKWREEYGSTIVGQLKRLGASCDWARERFTMDEGLSRAVSEVFVRLYKKGLIYKANYIINWCPRCHTALSDEESEHKESQGKLYYIRYPLRPSEPGDAGVPPHLVVATTRPETLLGDVAVAMNPKEDRYPYLDRSVIVLPILGRELRVIRDDFVDPAFGTGLVKVTPAHDPNDFQMGMRHGLSPVNVMNGDGTMNEEAGPYRGMDRFECRRKILEDLNEAGLIERVEDHSNAVGHCYRCDTVVEPRLSPQWFVRMKPLAAPAIEAVKSGRVEFVPGRWTKVYLEWMENIRDWCISRQIWWGHRIPIFYCGVCGHEWAAAGSPSSCPECGKGDIRQDEDVLDTWFSSWLWPFSTFGWPEKNRDLGFYYPTHDLVTASEIIFFWVARMIMAGMEFMGDVPFSRVYIHGTVRDNRGIKMSKSLGNAIDPLDIIGQFSADALRFSLMMLTATGQDVFISTEKFEIGRNFGTKLWNAARFIRMHSDEGKSVSTLKGAEALDPAMLSADDKHILSRLRSAVADCTDNLEKYRFNDAAHVLYEFVWHQFCDWYVEYTKDVLNGDDAARRSQTLTVLNTALSNALRLLHPFMPFITEELWHAMGYGAEDESIMKAPWPVPADDAAMAALGADPGEAQYVEEKHDLIRAGRNLRADYGIPPNQRIKYLLKPVSAEAAARLEADRRTVAELLRAESLVIDPAFEPSHAMPGSLSGLGTVYMPLEGLIDTKAETARLSGQRQKLQKELEFVNAKLRNEGFVAKAPREVVEKQEARKQELLEKIDKLGTIIETLSGGK